MGSCMYWKQDYKSDQLFNVGFRYLTCTKQVLKYNTQSYL